MDELLLYYNDLFQDPEKVTLININYILYLTKLFPSGPNEMFCTTLFNSFKYLWNNQNHGKPSKQIQFIVIFLIIHFNIFFRNINV